DSPGSTSARRQLPSSGHSRTSSPVSFDPPAAGPISEKAPAPLAAEHHADPRLARPLLCHGRTVQTQTDTPPATPRRRGVSRSSWGADGAPPKKRQVLSDLGAISLPNWHLWFDATLPEVVRDAVTWF